MIRPCGIKIFFIGFGLSGDLSGRSGFNRGRPGKDKMSVSVRVGLWLRKIKTESIPLNTINSINQIN
jgi:hypothetical protein